MAGVTAGPRRLTIDGVTIDDDAGCYVIAEIGHNHQGDLAQAKQLIAAAKECGVDAVKLDPHCIDAYFNLSRLYEKKGEKLAAIRHLKDYRRLRGS